MLYIISSFLPFKAPSGEESKINLEEIKIPSDDEVASDHSDSDDNDEIKETKMPPDADRLHECLHVLDSMLGTLEERLSKNGITTSYKGNKDSGADLDIKTSIRWRVQLSL